MTRSSSTLVAITQPYVPGYRVPLWERVISNLRAADIECRVFYGGDSEQLRIRAGRGDGVETEWATQVPTHTLALHRRLPKLIFRRLPRGWRSRRVLLVTEMQASNVNAWLAIVSRRRFVTLGHGASDTTAQNKIATMLENKLNRSANHVLTYTAKGRSHVVHSGRVPPERVTSFQNATDTVKLRAALESVTAGDAARFRAEHGIPDEAVIGFYLGALNRHKNIGFLVAAAKLVFAASDKHWLVVAGWGEDSAQLEDLARESGRVVLLGQASAAQFAPAATQAVLLLNPGRVGLVAVDALIMGLPILTTSASAHAPEFDYLRPGVDVIETNANPAEYADAWLGGLSAANVVPSGIPSVEAAADIISAAIVAQLAGKG
jgi:glycosyltransferase involved in cell wall biosynthesis